MNETEARMLLALKSIQEGMEHRKAIEKDISDYQAKIDMLEHVKTESLRREIELRDNLKEIATHYAEQDTW